MKRTIPLLIASIGGIALIIAFFVPATESWGVELTVWFDILAAIAFILGGGNLLKVHLQKVSDQKPGWGFSGLILGSFLITLILGLWKVGSHPSPNTEFYGQSFLSVPISALPQFEVPGRIPTRGDGRPLPPSVIRQISSDGTVVRFQGWPTPIQINDLMAYQDELEWQCTVEKLAAIAVPPPALAGKLSYEPDHSALAFEGTVEPDDEVALRQLFANQPEIATGLDRLVAASRKETSLPTPSLPKSFVVPDSARSQITLADGRMTIVGPMTSGLRRQLSTTWPAWELVHPFSPDQRRAFLTELNERGATLTEPQVEAANKEFDSLWTAEQLVTAINIAGVPAATDKSACECLAEKQAGAITIDPKRPPAEGPVSLSPAQVDALQKAASLPNPRADRLIEVLKSAGELRPAQEAAIGKFLGAVETLAQFRRKLFFSLRKVGPLTSEQREFLLAGAREEANWKAAITNLFLASHQVKYPWSGDYTEQGTPFWWIYEYVLQPLMTTTFALLAFYVASAAFRAFRAKNLEATLLLGTAFIVLFRSTPFGPRLSNLLPDRLGFLKLDSLTAFIMSVPNTAGNRAIMIGIALGIAATSLKVLLGLDKSYLGSDD